MDEKLNDFNSVQKPSEFTNVLDDSTSTPILPQTNQKILGFRKKWITVIVLALLISVLGILFFINNQRSNKESLITNEPLSLLKTTKRSTSLLAFIRDGDVWIGSVDGKDCQQITSHPKISYEMKHFYSGNLFMKDDTNTYAKYPRISHDGKYLSYIALTQESIDDVEKRIKRIATESAQVKSSGNSEIFNSPLREYALHIYNISERKEENLVSLGSVEVDNIGNFKSFKWAASRNALFFIKDFNLHMVSESVVASKIQLTHSMKIKHFCSFPACDASEYTNLISVKPDGSQIASTYTTGNNCGTFVEFKLLTFDFKDKEIVKQPSDLSWCKVVIGPWSNDKFFAVEYNNNPEFYLYSPDDWSDKELLFEDDDYQYEGPLALSPDNRYITYPLGEHTYGSSGAVNLRIRDLQTNNYVDLIEVIRKQGDFKGNKVLNAKWDSEGEYLYFTLLGDNQNVGGSLLKYEVSSKKVYLVVENAVDIDIN